MDRITATLIALILIIVYFIPHDPTHDNHHGGNIYEEGTNNDYRISGTTNADIVTSQEQEEGVRDNPDGAV